MSKDEIIQRIAENLSVRWTGYGTWTIESYVWAAFSTGDDHRFKMKSITHNEDDKTGIFDGETYNPLCGFEDKESLEDWARNECEGMSVEVVQNMVWSDTTDPDNYEPLIQRDLRLAERLYDIYKDALENLQIV